MLIALVLCLVALSLVVIVRRSLATGGVDLGSVSERWLAEYRADEFSPSR